MIFHRIVLEDVFSYCGRQELRLAPQPVDGAEQVRRVVLVMGRNGYGKTSLLNAVKLLFLGSDASEQRDVGFPPRTLSRKDYVLGNAGGWDGVINQRARGEGRNKAQITVELGPPEHIAIIASRSWTVTGNTFTEELEVRTEDNDWAPVKGESAEERLEDILPRELVPFFFFDGEEIQFLAQSGDEARATAMERLLSLNFVTGVEKELGELIKDWRRQQLPEEIKEKLTEKEGELENRRARQESLKQKIEILQIELDEGEAEQNSLRRRMESLRSEGIFGDGGRLESDLDTRRDELEKSTDEFVKQMATDAPLLAAPGLVKAALPHLDTIVDRKAGRAHALSEALSRTLPDRLFEEPPQPDIPLNRDQRRFFKEKLSRILESYFFEPDEPSFLSGLDLEQARTLRNRFHGLMIVMAERRQDRARRLRELSRKRAELTVLEAEWREQQFGSKERSEDYKRLEDEHTAVVEICRDRKRDIEGIDENIDGISNDIRQIDTDIKHLRKQHRDSSKQKDALDMAYSLRASFQEYRRRNRERKRHLIEEAVNAHLQALMSGHGLIHKVTVDDHFDMGFQDDGGQPVGKLTISHGMRQLVVTALLWALKDVSGRSLPMIVDTPLARIDRENQRALIEKYYPNAADQVIVLVTDSEIDGAKADWIAPAVSRRFHLENPDGRSTRFVPDDAMGMEPDNG